MTAGRTLEEVEDMIMKDADKEDIPNDWSELTQQVAKLLDPKSQVLAYWKARTRPDGRLFSQCRETTIKTGLLTKNAAGSALVTVGATTSLLAAVTCQVGTITTATPQGDVLVTVRPTTPEIAWLESFLQRVLYESIDLAALVVPASNDSVAAGIALQVTVQRLQGDDAGPDACLMAAVAALLDTVIPPLVVVPDPEGNNPRIWIDKDSSKNSSSSTPASEMTLRRVPMRTVPMALTMGLYEDDVKKTKTWMVDLEGPEQSCVETALTVVANAAAQGQVLGVDLTGRPVGPASLAMGLHLATGRAQELASILSLPMNKTNASIG